MIVAENTRRYVTVDVFADQIYQGNPLAVVLGAEGLSDAQMQSIAREFNYVESAFVLPPKNADHTARIRIFTPVREIPFAGHPNIGTAFVLAQEAKRNEEVALQHMIFEEDAGLVRIDLDWQQDELVGAELTCPEHFSRRSQLTALEAAACLGLNVDDVRTDGHLPQVASVGLPFLIIELASLDALRRARLNKDAHSRVLPLDGAYSIYLYTTQTDADARDADLHARMFTAYGAEDPATGSASAAASALLAELRGSEYLSLYIRQGVEMGRPSTLMTKVSRLGGNDPVVKLGGRAVTVMDGRVRVL
jgi:trans-2,3-dihydro-3-hydroxyanthranilate isomerase